MSGQATLIFPDGSERPLGDQTSVGRDADNDLVLDSPTVSRRHAIFARRHGRWYVADTGSLNGTVLNGDRIRSGVALQLRHADRLGIGSEQVVFSCPAQLRDPQRTEPLPEAPAVSPLSDFQLQIVACLCSNWLAGGSLDELPTNRQIAARLGTPEAEEAVKSGLRRVYAKAGLTAGSSHAKRRALCRLARQQGWV